MEVIPRQNLGVRLIAGQAGGLTLEVPKSVTRPTQDRVRQAIFSMLGEIPLDARVLDLFAGSGALGLESLSRGASSALFVDQNKAACEVIRRNLAKSRLQGGTVRAADAFRFLKSTHSVPGPFDLIFADPPYAHRPGDPELALQLAQLPELLDLLVPGGHLILECRVTNQPSPSWSPWELVRERDYGTTRILWLRKPEHAPAPPQSSDL